MGIARESGISPQAGVSFAQFELKNGRI